MDPFNAFMNVQKDVTESDLSSEEKEAVMKAVSKAFADMLVPPPKPTTLVQRIRRFVGLKERS